MGKLEERENKNIRRTELQQAVLATVAAVGILGIGLVAPQVIGALSKLGLLPYSRKSEVIKSTASRLKSKGLLKFENGYYSLTAIGEKVLKRWDSSDYKLVRPKKWDKKWRVVIFDIPEIRKMIRNKIRHTFLKAGFIRLQDSVWVYPYDCEEVIGLLKADLGIGWDLLYLIVDQIENDKYLRKEFDLL